MHSGCGIMQTWEVWSMDKLDLILEKLGTLENNTADLVNTVSNLETKVTDLQLTLENETNRNIRTIAEGHLDLSRKLDDALKVENEKEMLIIRVNILENELRKIKAKLEIA